MREPELRMRCKSSFGSEGERETLTETGSEIFCSRKREAVNHGEKDDEGRESRAGEGKGETMMPACCLF